MSLSIGVVEIRYLEQPGQPMYRFMQDLMADPEAGINDDWDDDETYYWDGGGAANAFYEFYRDGLVKRAESWATGQDLNSTERATLLDWIDNLPYRADTDTIMLHLGI